MDINERDLDTGVAYGMPERNYKRELVQVGPGTPLGELMRRYWQPVFPSEVLKADKPYRVRVLGEDLILFRDKEGRPGLVHEHCTHRGTSLYYGRIEEDGIRCCYHGWKFDVKGHCIDQPCEVNRGEQNRHRVRQPWYPVEERYGLVFAYMGPPEKKPVLPRWEHLENLGPDEVIEVGFQGGYGPHNDAYVVKTYDFNWLQSYENVADAPHFPWLHYEHSGDQFGFKPADPNAPLPPQIDAKDMVARIVFEKSPLGVIAGQKARRPDGVEAASYVELLIPNAVVIPVNFDLLWIVPMDDENHYALHLRRKKSGKGAGLALLMDQKPWSEMTEEEHQRFPTDYEAQASIGKTPAHNWEHMSRGDAAVALVRRRIEDAVRDVQEGRDPPGVQFESNAPPLRTSATLIDFNKAPA